jgi:glycosyltransferase involved in cell wall biosynthesis
MESPSGVLGEETTQRVEISLVICTRNRAEKLGRMLGSLSKVADFDVCDLILVDNNSEDSTSEVIEQFKSTVAPRLQHLHEPRNGSAVAKNCGWRAARGGIVAFTDDDCYPDGDYLKAIRACFEEDAGLGYLGGRVLLHDPTDIKVTLQEREERVELDAHQSVQAGLIIGANFAFRRAALLEAGGFDEDFGAGTPFCGEDFDLLTRVSANGWRGAYDPRPVVFHAHGRKTSMDARRLMYQYDHGRGAYFVKLLLLRELRPQFAAYWYKKIRQQRIAVTLREIIGGVHYLSLRALRLRHRS